MWQSVNSVCQGKRIYVKAIREAQGKGLSPDGTTRFSYKGEPDLLHYMRNQAPFSEYTVVSEISLANS